MQLTHAHTHRERGKEGGSERERVNSKEAHFTCNYIIYNTSAIQGVNGASLKEHWVGWRPICWLILE